MRKSRDFQCSVAAITHVPLFLLACQPVNFFFHAEQRWCRITPQNIPFRLNPLESQSTREPKLKVYFDLEARWHLWLAALLDMGYTPPSANLIYRKAIPPLENRSLNTHLPFSIFNRIFRSQDIKSIFLAPYCQENLQSILGISEGALVFTYNRSLAFCFFQGVRVNIKDINFRAST